MNLRKIIIGIAIFILMLFVSSYGVDIFIDKPSYNEYCPNTIWKVSQMNESVCFDNGGKWNPGFEKNGYCDQNFLCNENYNLAQEKYSMNVFLVAVPLGILILIAGFLFFSLETVGVAVMAGGVGTLLRGVGSYWNYSQDWLKFAISLFGLIIVIYFTYKYNNKIEKKKLKRKKYKITEKK